MELPFGGTAASDTFETGTRAAAWGGTTSDHRLRRAALRRAGRRTAWPPGTRRPRATARSTTASTRSSAASTTTRSRRWTALIDEGITSFKLFMAYPGVFYSDDAQILRAMQKSRRDRPADDDARRERPGDRRARRAAARRRARPTRTTTASPAPGRWRRRRRTARSCSPTSPARRSTSCTSAPSRPSSSSPRPATRGQNVFGETCPQYLYLSLEEQLGATSEEWGGFEGAKWVCSTPLRSRAEGHQDHMWQALRTNDLQMVSTDHCPFCMKDQKELGHRRLPQRSPTASASIEHRMDLMYQGVVTGQITLERWVELTSTTPARMFGLYGKKGVIAARRRRRHRHLRPERPHLDRPASKTHHMNMDYSAWEGFEIDGHVDTVLSRGTVIVDDNAVRRHQGPRPVPQARPQSQYLDLEEARPWTSASSCRPTRRPARTVQLAELAEAHGFDHVWTFDSHLLWQEPYVIYSRDPAPRPSGSSVGPMVTNPATRDWTVTASRLRHPERDVRQPHDLRHRPRRLGGPGHQRQADDARASCASRPT